MYPAVVYLVTETYAILIMYYRRNHTLRILIIQVKRSPRLTWCHRRNHTLRILITQVKSPHRLKWIRLRFQHRVPAQVLLSSQYHHQCHLSPRPNRRRLPLQKVTVLWTLMALQWQGPFRCHKWELVCSAFNRVSLKHNSEVFTLKKFWFFPSVIDPMIDDLLESVAAKIQLLPADVCDNFFMDYPILWCRSK